MSNSYYLKKLRPKHLAVLRLWAQGLDNAEIAVLVGYTPATVSLIVNLPEAQELLEEMKAGTFETIADVRTSLQFIAPELLEEKIRLAFNAKSEQVRSNSCAELLALAGHAPLRKIEITRPLEVVDPYKGLSEEQLRERVFKELGMNTKPSSPEDTLH